MAEVGSIYSAVYSGVPVFEMVVNGVAIMRRRTDSYMNATQILKVASIDKGKRTKILEKEVLPGEHEKVQGGYGKYQGTWIPCDKSKELAIKYGVYEQLSPLIDFDLAATNAENGEDAYLTKEQALVARKNITAHSNAQPHDASTLASEDAHAPRKRTKTAAASTAHTNTPTSHMPSIKAEERAPPRQTTEEAINEAVANERNRSVLMSIFLSDKPDQIPDLLKNQHGKSGFNIDMVIDEQGNTALHWATALARTNTVQLLVNKGANIACTSYTGETALMRGVMVTNNFDNTSFPQVFDLLKESMTIVDNKKRSVLHHAALTAGIHGRTNAAVYYMRILIDYIKASDNEELRSLLDAQDSLGDTALNIAARLDCQALVDILSHAGAANTAQNQVGLNSQDYAEVKVSLHSLNDFTMDGMTDVVCDVQDVEMEETSTSKTALSYPSSYAKKPYTPSQRGKEIVATVQKIVDALDDEYGVQLTAKEQELQSVQEEVNAVVRELETTRKGLETRQAQSQRLSEAQQKTRNIEAALDAGWKQLESIITKSGKSMPQREDIENIDENEDIDGLFNVPELHVPDDATEEEKKRKLDEYIRNIQAKVKAYRTNDEALRNEIEKLQNDYVTKEMECKRLIAACCNLPIDKIDDLVEPLTLAIESDPPDLDLARVIGFMDKIRRQGAFAEPATATSTTSTTTTSATTAATTAPAALPTVLPTSPDQESTNDRHHDTVDNPPTSLSFPNIASNSPAL
ncbi:apses-domain-containing protein [Mucor ambiguus]|uniref:Apses-domain-containing protein n=1 Tax=Mucor ambiguus TaxID=91626 RepID=A0A0C9ML87_9FUNG|nr:apses-domain-containing protein [Mucor ambiguus]